jgi:hypothetical protein
MWAPAQHSIHFPTADPFCPFHPAAFIWPALITPVPPQVAAYVRTRTLDEVLLMVKEHQGASSTRMKAQEDWKGAAKKRADVTSEADLRCAAFTDVEVSHPRDCYMAFT